MKTLETQIEIPKCEHGIGNVILAPDFPKLICRPQMRAVRDLARRPRLLSGRSAASQALRAFSPNTPRRFRPADRLPTAAAQIDIS